MLKCLNSMLVEVCYLFYVLCLVLFDMLGLVVVLNYLVEEFDVVGGMCFMVVVEGEEVELFEVVKMVLFCIV